MQGLQMSHELVNHFFEVGHLMNRFLIFNCEKEAVMAPYKEVYKDMQKRGKQLHSLLSLLSLLSPPLPCTLHHLSILTAFSQEHCHHSRNKKKKKKPQIFLHFLNSN